MILNGFEKEKIMHHIAERMKIVDNYSRNGVLDRQQAIQKIVELLLEDNEVSAVTAAKLVSSPFVPWGVASDKQIIEDLKMQIVILTLKLMNFL